MTRIVASIPGRIRLRDPALRQPAHLERLLSALGALPAALAVEGNLGAGSIVLRYDAARVPVEAMEAAVDQAADAEFARPRSAYKPSTRVRLNRYAKRGMLVTLSASLALAAVGQKRWHALTGGAFVACLAIHLAVHRRNLVR